MPVTNMIDPINGRFKIRVSFGTGKLANLGYGSSVKLILIDEQNLPLTRNILELVYLRARRMVKPKEETPSLVRQKGLGAKPPLANALKFMSLDFVEECCKLIGYDYRRQVLSALKRLDARIHAIG